MPRYDWDIKPLTYMVDSKKERAFKRAGAYIRADARQSIRVSIRNSKPGEPPKAKRRTFKNSIVFVADKESVVTGPIRQHPANSTPHVLESGGWRSDTRERVKARWERANPEKAREQRRQMKAAAKLARKNQATQDETPKRVRSEKELKAIQRWYEIHGDNPNYRKGKKKDRPADYLTPTEKNEKIRFYIQRRPYIEPAFQKNKQKMLALFS